MACLYTEDLTCSVCVTFFVDPVSLLCGHSFCRKCVTKCLSTSSQCPQCNETVPTEEKYLPTNHILKSLAEKAKEAATMKIVQLQECLCPEHDEKLKLFCETDQQLACVICRDGEKHEGHKFKPIKEAAVSLRRELEKGVENLCSDVLAIERQAQAQREEITTTKEKSSHLMTQINAQFEEMYQFLTKRKGEIKKELQEKEREAVEKMSEKLNAMETALSECKGIEVRARSCLEMTDPEKFLQSWTEGTSTATPESLFNSRAMELQVTSSSVSLGPYESHLQFFVWKELLQVVNPLPERLTLKRDNTALMISDDGRSLFWSVHKSQLKNVRSTSSFAFGTSAIGQPTGAFGQQTRGFGQQTRGFGQQTSGFGGSPCHTRQSHTDTATFSANEFGEGQHYWEIEVGNRAFWELGVYNHFLRYNGQKYSIYNGNFERELTFTGRHQRIGIYLNCSSKQVCFYDAANMEHVDTITSTLMSMPLSAYFNLGYNNDVQGEDCNPLTVCWY